MKIGILFLSLLPEFLVPSSKNDVHHFNIKVSKVDPTCTSADGSCVKNNVLLPELLAPSANDVHQSNIKVSKVDPTCTSADGSCMKKNVLLPELLAPSATDVHHSNIKVSKVDPSCTSADGSCVTNNVIKEWANNTAGKETLDPTCNSADGSCMKNNVAKKFANTTAAKEKMDKEKMNPTCISADSSCIKNNVTKETANTTAAKEKMEVCEDHNDNKPEELEQGVDLGLAQIEKYTAEELEQGVDLGVAQIIQNSDFMVTKEQVTEKLAKARKHINSDSVKNVSEQLKDFCKNENEMCAAWAIHGECQKDHALYMQRSCAPVCETCETWTCEDADDRCSEWAADGECKANPIWMLDTCRLSCKACSKVYTPEELEQGADLGVAQVLQNPQFRITEEQLTDKLEKARKHIHSDSVKNVSEQLKDFCKNENEMCAAWAIHGECKKDHALYMQRSCAPVCETCETWTCEDDHDKCSEWAANGECEANPIWMVDTCRLSCKVCSLPEKVYTPEELEQGADLGVAQVLQNSDVMVTKEQLTEKLEKARKHINSDRVNFVSYLLKDFCKNENEMCAAWAIHGECHKDHALYMQRSCAPVCETCETWTCEDADDRCSEWAADGECETNPIWMVDICRLSCKVCSLPERVYMPEGLFQGITTDEPVEDCQDYHEKCSTWAERGQCETNLRWMLDLCSLSCKVCSLPKK